jgi:hypothetical protein
MFKLFLVCGCRSFIFAYKSTTAINIKYSHTLRNARNSEFILDYVF